jgi:hypothetical protein
MRGTVQRLVQVVRGYFQYHAIPGNGDERLAVLLPPVQILQPYPNVRFDAKDPNIRGKNRVR